MPAVAQQLLEGYARCAVLRHSLPHPVINPALGVRVIPALGQGPDYVLHPYARLQDIRDRRKHFMELGIAQDQTVASVEERESFRNALDGLEHALLALLQRLLGPAPIELGTDTTGHEAEEIPIRRDIRLGILAERKDVAGGRPVEVEKRLAPVTAHGPPSEQWIVGKQLGNAIGMKTVRIVRIGLVGFVAGRGRKVVGARLEPALTIPKCQSLGGPSVATQPGDAGPAATERRDQGARGDIIKIPAGRFLPGQQNQSLFPVLQRSPRIAPATGWEMTVESSD